MSNHTIRAVCIVGSLILTAVVLQLIRKRKLREEYGLLWIVSSIAVFLAGCFIYSLNATLVTLIGLLLAVLLVLSQSVKLSAHQDCIRDLAQYTALLEWRIQQLESEEQQLAPDSFIDPAQFAIPRRETVDDLIDK